MDLREFFEVVCTSKPGTERVDDDGYAQLEGHSQHRAARWPPAFRRLRVALPRNWNGYQAPSASTAAKPSAWAANSRHWARAPRITRRRWLSRRRSRPGWRSGRCGSASSDRTPRRPAAWWADLAASWAGWDPYGAAAAAGVGLATTAVAALVAITNKYAAEARQLARTAIGLDADPEQIYRTGAALRTVTGDMDSARQQAAGLASAAQHTTPGAAWAWWTVLGHLPGRQSRGSVHRLHQVRQLPASRRRHPAQPGTRHRHRSDRGRPTPDTGGTPKT